MESLCFTNVLFLVCNITYSHLVVAAALAGHRGQVESRAFRLIAAREILRLCTKTRFEVHFKELHRMLSQGGPGVCQDPHAVSCVL